MHLQIYSEVHLTITNSFDKFAICKFGKHHLEKNQIALSKKIDENCTIYNKCNQSSSLE